MSEELTNVAGTTSPAHEEVPTLQSEVIPNAEPVVPVAVEPTVPAVDPSTITGQEVAATAEQPPAEEAQPSEPIVVPDELVEKAIEVIKESGGKIKRTFLSLKLKVPFEMVKALDEKLVERGIMNMDPASGFRGLTRDFMATIKPKVEVTKPVVEKPSAPVAPTPKRKMTDYDRLQLWKQDLKEYGKFTDDALIEQIAQFALKNPGFNPEERRSRTLITMINRWHLRNIDRIRTINPLDCDELHREILRLLAEKPLGDGGPAVWNTQFANNRDQERAVSAFWGINKRERDCSTVEQMLVAVRSAAWPSIKEEERGEGGTFAERLHYLVLALLSLASDERLFQSIVHDTPSQAFIEQHGGFVPSSWNDGAKCNDCGAELTTDANGNTICSNLLCMHHYVSAGSAPESFRTNQGTGGSPRKSFTDAPREDRPARKNWKKRDGDSRDNGRGFDRRPNRKHWRENNEEEVEQPQAESVPTYTAGSAMPPNNPFAGLKLPEPPPETPVV